MPADSQAITSLQIERAEAVDQLQDVQERLAAAEAEVTRLTNAEASLVDKIADIDASITATTDLP